jgi:tRNA threonylcarbamoyladenosine biosynthesis protein TsaB
MPNSCCRSSTRCSPRAESRFGAGIGVVPVSDLMAVAERVVQLQPGVARVLVVNDARMREVYWAEYPASPLLISMSVEERVGPAGSVLLPAGPEAWAAAGRGLRAWPELAERCRLAGASLHPDLLPRASDILRLARAAVASGQVLDPAQALPVYVRDRVAEPSVHVPGTRL